MKKNDIYKPLLDDGGGIPTDELMKMAAQYYRDIQDGKIIKEKDPFEHTETFQQKRKQHAKRKDKDLFR